MRNRLNSIVFVIVLLMANSKAFAIEELKRMPFLMYSDFSESSGVVLEAQIPIGPPETMVLYHKGSSSVFETPMASRVTNEGVYEIWYLRVDPGNTSPIMQYVLCLGEIRNNQWNLVATQSGLTGCGNENVNNTVMQGSGIIPRGWGVFYPQQIIMDPSGGLLMFYWDQAAAQATDGGDTGAGVMRATASYGGRNWTKVPGRTFSDLNDSFTATRVGNQYRIYQTGLQPWPNKPIEDTLPDWKRVITLRTSNDSSSWTAQDVNHPMLAPDAVDDASTEHANTEFYAFKSFAYGSGYGGLLWKYYAKNPGEHAGVSDYKYELVVSKDGIAWQRPFRNTDIGFFSHADPIAYASKLLFPTQDAAGNTILKGWPTDRMVAATGDGGTFRTRPFYFPPRGIDINANTWNGGWVDVTVCDSVGTPIVGWSPYRIQNDNGLSLQLPWSAGHEPVSIRVTLGGGAKVFGISARSPQK